MKRVLAFLAVSAAILAVSCNKEQDNQGREEGNLASVSFTVSQADLMTKADPVDPKFGDATKVNQLLVQVFNKVGDNYVKLEAPEMTITPANSTPASWHVDMKLAKNETYKIAFWAQKSGNEIYNTTNLSEVTINYSKVAINNDDADAFCAARFVTVTGSLSEKVLLYRPLAQINIGTNDLASYKKSVVADKQNLTATITLPVGTPNKLNVIGGAETNGVVSAAISGSTTAETAFTTAPAYVMEGKTLTSGGKTYDYLAMLYVLAAPGKETMTFKAKLNNSATDVSDLTVSNMPYQANYRTNIVGQLLTGTFEFNVEVEKGFYADFEKKVSPTFATLADLNAYFATMQDDTPEGDNGDINPEQVTLTALGTVDGTPQIKLPVISGDVDIRVVFDYDDTIEVVYGDASDGAKKPANVFFFAKNLTTLKATVPASHFELLSGSVVTNKAIVSTNTTTFVIQKGAKVGKVEIEKGNAEVSGEVHQIEVIQGATADGENPVEVFLNKESGVDEIVLNAKTNVVVEQPKDHIDVEATEKKVAVYVNAGADNSTAKAQNGGQIYVKVADGVTCEVMADGQSTAEEGSVPSTVTIAEVGEGANVYTETSDGGKVETAQNADIDGNIAAYVAQIKGGDKYTSLEAAFAAAVENDEIIVLANCAVTANIPVNFDLTLNVAGYTITNNVTGNRLFRVGGEGTMLEIKGGNGKIVIPESNKGSYGFVDLRNQQNVASYYAGLKASNVDFIGATTGGSFFQARTHYQQFLFENVNVDCTDGDGIVYDNYANGLNASIINCYNCQICTVSIKGGTFKYASRGVNYGVFQDYFNAFTTMEDVTVISSDGPVNQGMSYSCLIKNCNFANPNNVSAWDWTNTCICASNNKTIEVDGGSYEGNYACYVYTSGGTIHIKDGSFTGRSAVLIAQVDNNTYSTASSNIIVDGGTFNGPIKMDQGANCSITINAGTFTAEAGKLFGTIYGTLSIKGGTFSENPSAYVAQGYSAIDNGNGTWTVIEGVIYYHSEEDTQNKGKLDNFIKNLPDGTKVLLTSGYYIGSQISEHNQIHEQNLTIAGFEDGVVFQGPGDGVSSVRGRYGLRLRSYAQDATPDHHEVTLKDLKIIGGYEPNWSSWMPALYCRGNLTANLENVVLESNNDVALEFDVKDDFMAAEGVYAEVNLEGVTIQEGKKINVSGDGTAATVRITWANCTNINDASFTCTGCENVVIYVNGVELEH